MDNFDNLFNSKYIGSHLIIEYKIPSEENSFVNVFICCIHIHNYYSLVREHGESFVLDGPIIRVSDIMLEKTKNFIIKGDKKVFLYSVLKNRFNKTSKDQMIMEDDIDEFLVEETNKIKKQEEILMKKLEEL